MTKIAVNRAIAAQSSNALQQRVDRRELPNRLAAHALSVRGDRPTYDDNGEFLGHWQGEEWIEKLRSLARELADLEKDKWIAAEATFINSQLEGGGDGF
jgi:hypothetical protein